MANTYGNINVPDFYEDVDLTEIEQDISDLKSNKADKSALDGKADKTALDAYLKSEDAGKTYATKGELEDKADQDDLESLQGEVEKKIDTETADGKYATKTELNGKADAADLDDYALKTDLVDVMNYKGTVAAVADLEGKKATAKAGDVYNVTETGMNYAYDGSGWDALGREYDLSGLAEKATVQALQQEVDKKADANDLKDLATKDEVSKKADASALSGYATTGALEQGLAGKADSDDLDDYVLTDTAESTYAKKSEIPTDYLTDEDIEDFVTGDDVDGKITNATKDLASNTSVQAVASDVTGLKSKIITITETTYSMDPSSFTGSDTAGYDGVATVTGLGATDKFNAYYNPEQYDAYRAAGITGITSQSAGQFGVHSKRKPSVTLTGTVEIRKEGIE